MRFRFDRFELDTDRFALTEGGSPVHIEPLVFDLLACLVRHPGQVLTRDTIVDEVWKGRFVSEATVSSCIKSARRALGDTGQQQAFIRTIRGRGIQLTASVEVVGEEAPANVPVRDVAPPAEPPDAAAVPQAPPGIAVLPLHPLAQEPILQVLGDALAQEIIHELSRLHWLFVIARGSTFQFRGQEIDPCHVGRTLGAGYVLSGTIEREGRDCAVAVELCRAGDRSVIWAGRFAAPLGEAMHLRSRLAVEIVGALEPRIEMAEALRAARLPTERLDAWSAYHRGVSHMYRFNKHDNELAEQLFSHAVKLDPGFARAHAGLSFTHFQNDFLGFRPDRASERRLMRHHAVKGLEIDPLDPFVNLTMGRADWIEGDLEASLPWMERSIALRPSYAFALYNSALVGTLLGEGEVNEGKVAKAMALSPIDPLQYAMLATRAVTHVVRGNYETAVEWAERAIRAPNAHVQIYAIAAFICDLAGQHARAAEHVAYIRRSNPAYSHSDFLHFFPFGDAALRMTASESLRRLGL